MPVPVRAAQDAEPRGSDKRRRWDAADAELQSGEAVRCGPIEQPCLPYPDAAARESPITNQRCLEPITTSATTTTYKGGAGLGPVFSTKVRRSRPCHRQRRPPSTPK